MVHRFEFRGALEGNYMRLMNARQLAFRELQDRRAIIEMFCSRIYILINKVLMVISPIAICLCVLLL